MNVDVGRFCLLLFVFCLADSGPGKGADCHFLRRSDFAPIPARNTFIIVTLALSAAVVVFWFSESARTRVRSAIFLRRSGVWGRFRPG